MELQKGKCPVCGNYGELIFSNNPLVPAICVDCVKKEMDVENLEHADFFCRTYNLPFDPNKWIKMFEREPDNVIQLYMKQFLSENKENLHYQSSTKDLWKMANTEWEKTKTHNELLSKVESIKKSFIERGKIKWGTGYSFNELIQLENLFASTVSSFDINNPMQIDVIKKACKLSVLTDQAIASGEIKDIRELSAAHTNFLKMAQIDEMIEASQSDVIRTVADLVQHLEEKGFEFDYYDGVERDVYDKTINEMKGYLRTLVLESTGLEQTLEIIQEKYSEAKYIEQEAGAESVMPLDEVVRRAREEFSNEIDEELDEEDILDD